MKTAQWVNTKYYNYYCQFVFRNEHGLTFRMLIVASSVVVLSNDNRNKMTPKVLIRYVDHLNANVN